MATSEQFILSKLTMEDLNNVPYHLIACPDCLVSSKTICCHPKYRWARVLKCEHCVPSIEWSVCIECKKTSSHMITKEQMKRHYFQRHASRYVDKLIKKKSIESDKKTSEDDYKSTIEESILLMTSADIKEEKVGKVTFQPGSITREESVRYFSNEIGGGGVGIPFLVGRACFNEDNVFRKLDQTDIELNYLMAKLCLQLTRGERDMLSEVFYLITKKFTSKKKKSGEYCIDLPQTCHAIRQRFMEGVYSLIANLPHPEVHRIGLFAYVRLHDCVADLLAHGVSLERIVNFDTQEVRSIKRVTDSQKASEIYQRSRSLQETPDLTLCIIEWSDGFQPNTSAKQNRGSAYLKTVSFVIPENSSWSNSTYTYCYALGPAKLNPEPVERIFAEDLRMFQQCPLPKFFSKEQGRLVSVYLEVISVLQDQPERRKANNLSFGNSNYHARWGMSCDFKSLKDIFPSCDRCQKQLVENGTEFRDCRNCLSWNVEVSNPLCRYDPPKKFPNCSTINGKLVPFLLNYEVLQAAVDKCHRLLVEGTWKPSTAKAYLAVYCLNGESIKSVLEHAKYCKIISDVRDEGVKQKLDALRRRNPEKFEKWCTPPLWCRDLKLHDHIDTIMHLLFLGGSKTIMMDGHNWLTSCNKLTIFKTMTTNMYEQIQSLMLNWCKALPYGSGLFGAHVSENYLACTRLLKWFYQCLDFLSDSDDDVYKEPEIPQDTWTKVQNIQWLRKHGFALSGNAETVRKRVADNRNKDGVEEVILPTFSEQRDCFKESLMLWVNLVSNIMWTEMSDDLISSISLKTKLFLNAYLNFDKKTSSEKLPYWICHFNFLSLLNLPSTISRLGPLRNYWEGGICGEAIIATVKPEITMGFRKNWSHSVLTKIMRKKAFATIDESKKVAEKEYNVTSKLEKNSFKMYSGFAEVNYLVSSHQPISCIIHDNKIFVVLTDDTLLEVSFSADIFDSEVLRVSQNCCCSKKILICDFIEERLSLNYFEIVTTNNTTSIESIDSLVDYGLLLPRKKIPMLMSKTIRSLYIQSLPVAGKRLLSIKTLISHKAYNS